MGLHQNKALNFPNLDEKHPGGGHVFGPGSGAIGHWPCWLLRGAAHEGRGLEAFFSMRKWKTRGGDVGCIF